MIFATKKKIIKQDFLNEAPSVISMMSTVVSSGGSLDSAVRFVAEKGPKNTSKLFADIVNDADCRENPDIMESLYRLMSMFPKSMASFRRALYLVISASESREKETSLRLLDDASTVVLEGLKQAGETYSAKLQTPCMVTFGLGIMVPMILLSVVPLMNVGGTFGLSIGLPQKVLELIILAVVPAVIATVMLSINGENPMVELMDAKSGWSRAAILVLIVPAYVVLDTFDANVRMLASTVIPAMLTLSIIYPDIVKEKNRRKKENALKDVMFDLGNRLLSGENTESALVASLSHREECASVGEALSREYVLCRGDIESAIRFCIEPISEKLTDFFCDIYRTSLKDSVSAGKQAIALAHQMQDQDSVKKTAENKLKNMTDMMSGTAAVFAPLVLGMSMVMLEPLSVITTVNLDDTFNLISIYLVELALLMSFFSAILAGKLGATEITYRFSLTIIASMSILYVCTRFSL